jgi:hypothetical protein
LRSSRTVTSAMPYCITGETTRPRRASSPNSSLRPRVTLPGRRGVDPRFLSRMLVPTQRQPGSLEIPRWQTVVGVVDQFAGSSRNS